MENNDNKFIEVDSSLIEGYRYDSEKETLYVTFRSNGSQYAYFNVPDYEVKLISLNPANSGKVIKYNIIDSKKYPYKKL